MCQAVTQPTGVAKAYNGINFDNLIAMAQPDTIDQIAERVDHLLLRHEELQRTHVLLTQQIQSLTLERDQLKSRLSGGRARVVYLIQRLPHGFGPTAADGSVFSPKKSHSISLARATYWVAQRAVRSVCNQPCTKSMRPCARFAMQARSRLAIELRFSPP